jgi:hypothetical protein
VGGRQALDHFSSALAVLEVEELFVVDRRPHVERAQRLLARGRVQEDENARYPLAEVEQRPLEQLGTEVDGDARLPVVALRIEHLALVGVDGPVGAERSDRFSFQVARDGVRGTETRVGLRPLLGEAATGYRVRLLLRR